MFLNIFELFGVVGLVAKEGAEGEDEGLARSLAIIGCASQLADREVFTLLRPIRNVDVA